jgi:hypothetical protein
MVRSWSVTWRLPETGVLMRPMGPFLRLKALLTPIRGAGPFIFRFVSREHQRKCSNVAPMSFNNLKYCCFAAMFLLGVAETSFAQKHHIDRPDRLGLQTETKF